jgi:hypothetical protein
MNKTQHHPIPNVSKLTQEPASGRAPLRSVYAQHLSRIKNQHRVKAGTPESNKREPSTPEPSSS